MVDLNSSGASPRKIGLSLVVPCSNETESVGPFLARVGPIVEALMRPHGPGRRLRVRLRRRRQAPTTPWPRLVALRADFPAIRIVRLSRNFGKDSGVERRPRAQQRRRRRAARRRPAGPAGGDPRALTPKWLEGNDIVYATRVDRARTAPPSG